MNSINGNLNNSAGVRANIEDDESDSLATWLQASFRQQQRTGGHVTLTDTQRDGGQR